MRGTMRLHGTSHLISWGSRCNGCDRRGCEHFALRENTEAAKCVWVTKCSRHSQHGFLCPSAETGGEIRFLYPRKPAEPGSDLSPGCNKRPSTTDTSRGMGNSVLKTLHLKSADDSMARIFCDWCSVVSFRTLQRTGGVLMLIVFDRDTECD